MKRAATLRLILPLFLVSLLIGIRVSGQQAAKVEAPKKVTQGSDIVFQITTDKPANVAGNVGVQVVSVDGNQTLNSNTYSLGTGRTASVSLTIPLDAKTGTWKVTKVTFYASSGGIFNDLTPSGELTFEVSHEFVVLPSKAEVEIR